MTVDDKIIEKIQKLLAHAEGTDVEAEAAAFIEKAQLLMMQYAVDQEMVKAYTAVGSDTLVTREIFVPKKTPMTNGKRDLLNACAINNRCQMWYREGTHKAFVAGYEADVEYTVLLYTHLLGEMEMEMIYAQAESDGNVRTFKANFIQAYASRIHARLRAMNEKIVKTDEGQSMSLVLVGRKEAVERYVKTVAPNLWSGQRGAMNSDALASSRGRQAADAANIAGARGQTHRIGGG
jgi:hypothetical protein